EWKVLLTTLPCHYSTEKKIVTLHMKLQWQKVLLSYHLTRSGIRARSLVRRSSPPGKQS
ncbi:hypothetical protein KIN20_033240, partial [Parelaphostrongylus tenuis]